MSSTGSGASQRRSSTRTPIPSSASRRATRRLMCSPLPNVTIVRSRPSPWVRGRADRHVRVGPAGRAVVRREPAAVAGLVQVGACGRGRSVRGRRTRVPSTAAAARQVRSIAAASSGRAGRGDDQAGDVAQHADGVVVVEVAAEALLVAVAGDPHHHAGCGTGRWRRTAAWPPRRGAGPRRCAGRPGTGSRARAAGRTRPRRAPARGSTARRAACRTPAPRRPA